MLSTTHNLFGNLYFSEPTNGISWYGIHFLFDMCSFNFKLDWNINNNNNNNKTSPMRIQWDYHKKRELFDLMITMTQNYFIGNPCLSKLTNGISWYDIHFLFDVCSLNFKLDWDVNNSNNKTSLMRIQQNYHKKCERFNLMLSKIHNYLFNNLNHFKPANKMLLYDIHFLFNVYSFNFKLDRDVNNNNKTSASTFFLLRVNNIILPLDLFKWRQIPNSRLI